MDLVECINYANEVGGSNVYWQWDQAKRDEFKQYRAALNARNNTSTAPAIDDEEDDNGDTSECEQEVAFEPEEEQEQERAAARGDVEEGDSAGMEQQQPAVRKKNSRWIEYTQIAREELKQSTGKSKVPQKEVFALARKYYVEDGWAK
jgi:hypothetical protein